MSKIAFIVTFYLKNVIIVAVNEAQCLAYAQLRFGKQHRYIIAPATEWQAEYWVKEDKDMFIACYSGGKKE